MWPSLEGGASGTAGRTEADGAVGPALSPSGLGLEGSSDAGPLESGLADVWGDLAICFMVSGAGRQDLRVVTRGPVHRACGPVCLGHRLHCCGGHHTHGSVSSIKILTWHVADPRREGCGGRLPGMGF